ncbi:MAG: DUF3098 domain-containing protein [Dysgonamonadaceae bacterium]|jgi:uncharacterized membrane protein|nr:DUF3098 domain-containing protein [Dysgonamonadaceae bacterium]
MSQKNFALGRKNYIICALAVLFIIAGFVIMSIGPATTAESGFQPDIFSVRRIKVAPMVSLFGFVLMIVGILYPTKKTEKKD